MKKWWAAPPQGKIEGTGVLVWANCFAALTLTVITVTGCGNLWERFGSANPNPNPPFQNRLIEMISPISSQFDAKGVASSPYAHLKVYDANGHAVILDARKTPVFFEAYWCPHCQRTLKLWSENRSGVTQLPVMVSLGFAKGSTLADAVSVSKTEMKTFGLEKAKVYYYLGAPSDLVPGFPTLVFPHQGRLMMMQGEHTLPMWEQALSGQ